MRSGIIVATAFVAFSGLSAKGAQAQEWCGYSAHPHAIVQCGYSSQEGCENTIGKGAMCFINPYVTLNMQPMTPLLHWKPRIERG